MRNIVVKLVVALASIALIVPFAAIAFVIAERAVVGTVDAVGGLSLAAFALGGMLAGGVKNLSRAAGASARASALRIAAGDQHDSRRRFVNALS